MSGEFDPFKHLPSELRRMIWNNIPEGRIFAPTLQCVCGPKFPERCLKVVIDVNIVLRRAVSVLLQVSRESRQIGLEIYHKVGQGGLFDSSRDKFLVVADGIRITTRCDIHGGISGSLPTVEFSDPEWAHVKHVLYYVRGREPLQNDGKKLRCMFGGGSVKTITVLMDATGAAKESGKTWTVEDGQRYWGALEQGLAEPLDAEDIIDERSLPELIKVDDAAAAKEVECLLKKLSPMNRE